MFVSCFNFFYSYFVYLHFGMRLFYLFCFYFLFQKNSSLKPVPNAQVCVYLMVHITKLTLQTTFPKPLYIPHFACIDWDPGY
jgi:hypothetical protein